MSDALNFERDPLAVQHGLREEPLGNIDVANAWEVDDLEARVLARPTDPSNWADLIDTCRQLDRLTIPDSVLARLARETFYPVVANRTLKLLSLLQEIMEGRAEDGSLNNTALLLWQTHSRGDKALFSDESDINKERFRQAMTFRDPDDTESTLFCHWHGKINTPPFRIHFQWPVPVGEPRLKVVYIGPKITKN